MGSITSRPKAPDTSSVQYVYVPTPTYSSTSTPANTSTTTTDDNAAARQQTLLDRRRGRLSTVLTSFRGLLNDTVNGSRKALLGE